MVRRDQSALARALRAVFPPELVQVEWRALAGEEALYSPRVDIAIGPFAVDTRHEREYDRMARDNQRLLNRLHLSFAQNVRQLDSSDNIPDLVTMCERNPNARCFLAIEIEASGSRKHIMGGAINAAALGRLGLSLACSKENLQVLLRMRRYMRFLADAGKNAFDTANLMVLTIEQFADALGISLDGV